MWIQTRRPVLQSGLILKLAPNKWETSLQSNAVSHWLGANLDSVLTVHIILSGTETHNKRLDNYSHGTFDIFYNRVHIFHDINKNPRRIYCFKDRSGSIPNDVHFKASLREVFWYISTWPFADCLVICQLTVAISVIYETEINTRNRPTIWNMIFREHNEINMIRWSSWSDVLHFEDTISVVMKKISTALCLWLIFRARLVFYE